MWKNVSCGVVKSHTLIIIMILMKIQKPRSIFMKEHVSSWEKIIKGIF